MHGVLWLHPWVLEARRRGTFAVDDEEEGVAALMYWRAQVLGLDDVLPSVNPLARWRLEETGGDWAQDGRVHQLGWMQAAPLNLDHQRLPVRPVLTCLGDGLAKVGTVEPAGTHMVLPLHLDVARVPELPGSCEWFQMDEGLDPRWEFVLSLHISDGQEVLDPAALLTAVRARAAHVLDVELLDRPPVGVLAPGELEGSWLLGQNLSALHLRCRGPEWSVDMAAFATEVATHAATATGIEQTLFVSVTHTGPDTTRR